MKIGGKMKLTAETRREKYKEGPDYITLLEKLENIGLKLNNNIYFAGLMLVPPPIWLILTSFRTVVTASLYKVSNVYSSSQ